MRYENIPHELRDCRQWVCWRFENRGENKLTKVPYSPIDSTLASINNPGDWSDFDTAVNASSNFDGIGFVISVIDPFCFIDLDKTDNPEFQKRQIEIYSEFDSYSEISPGGGLHIICKAQLPTGRRRDSIEIYTSSRFMTMTGNRFGTEKEIKFRQDAAHSLWESLEGTNANSDFANFTKHSLLNDLEVYNTAISAANGDKFAALWNGDFNTYHGGDQSRADFALVDILAFYTQDREQITRLFRMSGLGKRPKAKRSDYVNTMITRAFDKVTPEIDLSKFMQNLSNLEVKPGATDHIVYTHDTTLQVEKCQPDDFKDLISISDQERLQKEIDEVFQPPPGLVGELARFIYSHAYKPVPQIAVLGALGFMAGIAGRAYNASGNGLNLYILLLARTGRGKDAVSLGYEKLFKTITPIMPLIRDFKGPGDVSSGQALTRHMGEHKTKSFVSVFGEFGPILKRICSPLAFGPDLMTQKVMLNMWSQSGKDGAIDPTVYSDVKNNTKEIHSPAFSFFAECAPEWFNDSVDTSMVSTGLLPRFIISEYNGIRVPSNKMGPLFEPPKELIYNICSVVTCALSCFTNNTVCNIPFDAETQELSDKFEILVDSRINDNPDRIISEVWNRAHLNVVRVAGLIAVGINCYNPVITRECWDWASRFVTHNLKQLEAKFNDGVISMVDSDTEFMECEKVTTIIIQYLTNDFEKLKSYRIPELLHKQKVIPFSFIQRRLMSVKPFSKNRLGAGFAIKRAIQNLLDNGDIIEIQKVQAIRDLDFHGRCFAVTGERILNRIKDALNLE